MSHISPSFSQFSLIESLPCLAQRVKLLVLKVCDELTVNVKDLNPTVAKVYEEITLIDEYEGVRAAELRHINFLPSNKIVNSEGLVFLFYQNLLVELFYELYFS